MQQRSVPGNKATPVMTNHGEGVVPQGRSNACNVGAESTNVVVSYCSWPITATEPTLVRDCYLESGFNEGVGFDQRR